MPRIRRHGRSPSRLLAGVLAGLAALPAAAGPLDFGRTRLVLAGHASATLAPADRGYFNYTDYSASTLRQVRLTLEAELRHGARAAFVAAVRAVNLDDVSATALYLRLRPWPEHAFDVQAGRIPPVFGGFGRRRYGSDAALVGLPLAYQYLTTLRYDTQPPSADALLRWRGGGWRPGYAPGTQPGLPLVQGDPWDTGAEVRLGRAEQLELAVAVTQGSLGRPLVRDDNGGKQLSARLARRFGYALSVGLSAARGAYRARGGGYPGAPGADRQRAVGCDVEWARGHVLLRAEALWSAWDVPAVRARPLEAWSVLLEGRVRVAPAFDVAARADHLGFDVLDGATRRGTWDAPAWRVEAGIGYKLRRGVRLKLAYQHNWRDGGRVRAQGFLAGQVGVQF